MTPGESQQWPSIPISAWRDTRDTLQLHTQVVGKISLANEPLLNHWWNTTLHLTARSLQLEDCPVTEFHGAVMAMLDDLGLSTTIWPMPVEIPDGIPFVDDKVHARYDGDAVRRSGLP